MRKITFEGTTYTLTADAEPTSRLMPYAPYHEAEEGESYWFEMSAPCQDADGNEYTMYWEFEAVKGQEQELDQYDYDSGITKVEPK